MSSWKCTARRTAVSLAPTRSLCNHLRRQLRRECRYWMVIFCSGGDALGGVSSNRQGTQRRWATLAYSTALGCNCFPYIEFLCVSYLLATSGPIDSHLGDNFNRNRVWNTHTHTEQCTGEYCNFITSLQLFCAQLLFRAHNLPPRRHVIVKADLQTPIKPSKLYQPPDCP